MLPRIWRAKTVPNGLACEIYPKDLGGIDISSILHQIHLFEAFVCQSWEGRVQIRGLLFDDFRRDCPVCSRLQPRQACF